MSKNISTSLGYECSVEGDLVCVDQNLVGTYRDEWYYFTKEDLLTMISLLEQKDATPE